jgi:hypothetical protein
MGFAMTKKEIDLRKKVMDFYQGIYT